MKDPEPLLAAIKPKGRMLVVAHNNPDPDAIGAALGLQFLIKQKVGIEVNVAYGGIVGRAENRKLMKLLNIKASKISRLDLKTYPQLALVDSQPAGKNHSLPPRRKVAVCIDHHPKRDNKKRVRFLDVDEAYSSSCAIVADYIFTAGLDVGTELATALCYGIKTDTNELTRGVSKHDIDLFMRLYQRADKPILGDITSAREPLEYFEVMAEALERAVRVGNVVIVNLDEVPYADVVAEVADFFLRLEGITCTAATAFYGGEMVGSVRSSSTEIDAGKLIKRAFDTKNRAGGEEYAGGGRVPLPNNKQETHTEEKAEFVERLLKELDLDDHHATALLRTQRRKPHGSDKG